MRLILLLLAILLIADAHLSQTRRTRPRTRHRRPNRVKVVRRLKWWPSVQNGVVHAERLNRH